MRSIASRTIPLAIRLLGWQKRFSTAEATHARIAHFEAHPAPHTPPRHLAKRVDITLDYVGGWPVYQVSARGRETPRRALYLHGGSYVFQIVRQHWDLIAALALSTGSRITVPIYPLAPQASAETIVPTVTGLAAELIAEVGAERFSLLGDSAGGGMALAVAMQLRDRGVSAPRVTVLISPWLDISGTDPALAVIAPRDPWLAVPGARAAGELYRGTLSQDDPMVSPIHGDLSGLGAISMFSGTRDILNADARRLMEKASAAALPIDYHEVAEMLHVYPLLPIPEAAGARRVIRYVMTS